LIGNSEYIERFLFNLFPILMNVIVLDILNIEFKKYHVK